MMEDKGIQCQGTQTITKQANDNIIAVGCPAVLRQREGDILVKSECSKGRGELYGMRFVRDGGQRTGSGDLSLNYT